MCNIPRKQEYNHFLDKLGDRLFDIEHYRHKYGSTFYKTLPSGDRQELNSERNMNVAVAVMRDGRCYVGVAKQNYRDQYCRRIGHSTAVGRALKKAVDKPIGYEFAVDTMGDKPIVEGVKLRDYCRDRLRKMGVM